MSNTPQRVLMCPPDYYRIPEAENVYMDVNDQPDPGRARAEWEAVCAAYEALGLDVHLLEPREDCPDMVFAANGAWGRLHPDGRSEMVLSNFKYPVRRTEFDHYRLKLQEMGCTTFELPDPDQLFFEGQGDVITTTRAYLFGYGQRSVRDAAQYITRLLKLEDRQVIPLELVDRRFYHLDTCCMALRGTGTEILVYYPEAFGRSALNRLRTLQTQTLEIPERLAAAFICNSVFVNGTVLLNIPFEDYSERSFELSAAGERLGEPHRDPRYDELLRHEPMYEYVLGSLWRHGYRVVPVYTSQYMKSGAGVRCLTLFVD